MKNLFRLIFLLSILYFPAYSQQDTASFRIFLNDFRYLYPESGNLQFNSDSVLSSWDFFERPNGIQLLYPRTGNLGSASLNLFTSTVFQNGIRDGFDQFEPYRVPAYPGFSAHVKQKRFTNINYHIASRKEQHIFLTHQQRVKPWWYFGLDFGALSSQGDFARQLNKNRNFRLWNIFETPGRLYRNYASYTGNKATNQENGGITSNSVFENASSLDTRTIPIFLSNSSTNVKTREYFLKQELNLSRMFTPRDSISSSEDFNEHSFILSHAFRYLRKSVLFNSENADSGYFVNYYVDTLLTRDSAFIGNILNEFFLDYHSGKGRFNYFLGGGFNFEDVDYFVTDRDLGFHTARGLLRAGFTLNNLNVSLQFSKNTSGDFKDAWNTMLLLKYHTGSNLFYVSAASGKYSQALKDYYYFSNHFSWNNSFDLLERNELSAGIEISKLRTSVRFYNAVERNRIFYREDFLPQVYSDPLSYGQLTITNVTEFGKFGINDRLTFAYSGNENVIRFPVAVFNVELYYKNLFFKKALGFRAGLDLNYHAAYYGYGYMPATGIFYLQDEKKIGNYPMAGVFVDIKIKTASIFLRLDHLNAGIGSRTYYGAYGYPLQGRVLKLGINWELTD